MATQDTLARDPLTHGEAAALSRQCGESAYRIRRLWDEGFLDDLTPRGVSRALLRQALDRDALMTEDEIKTALQMDDSAFNEMVRDGWVLPTADGLYISRDFVRPAPHTFGVLPEHPRYTPVRPVQNEWRGLPMGETAFFEMIESRKQTCRFVMGRHNGRKRGMWRVADGYYMPDRWADAVQKWEFSLPCRPPQVSPHSVPHNYDGTADRIIVQAYTTKTQTIVNLCLIDDYGVPARSYGVYDRPFAWGEALSRAVNAIGFDVPPARDTSEECRRLQDWLNGVVEEP